MSNAEPVRFTYLVDRGPSSPRRPAARLVQLGITVWFLFGFAWPGWPPGVLKMRRGPDIEIHTFEDFAFYMAIPFLFTLMIVLMAEPTVHGLGPRDLWRRLTMGPRQEAEVTVVEGKVCLLSGEGDRSVVVEHFRIAHDEGHVVMNFGGIVFSFQVEGGSDQAAELVRRLEELVGSPQG